jgi:hypothetical protein
MCTTVGYGSSVLCVLDSTDPKITLPGVIDLAIGRFFLSFQSILDYPRGNREIVAPNCRNGGRMC